MSITLNSKITVLVRDGPLDIWGGGVGQIPKKNSRTEKVQKKNIVHNKPIEKKNRARLGVILKIVMQLF
jgi:hypothetical protein